MSQKKLFISYSRRDTEYVSTLVEALRKQGFEVWFDKNIRTGTDWDSTIEEELKKADAIVLVLSKTSVESDNVKDEMSFGIGMDKPVIPIKIEECDVPMRLARKQFVDFTTMGHEEGFERLVNDLHIGLKEAETAVPKGTFKPPKQKKANPIKNYIMGGVGAVVLILILVMVLGGEDAEADTTSNAEWQTAINSNTVNSYLNYIYQKGPLDPKYKSAQDSIDVLMEYEGMVIYGDLNSRYFVKNLYTDMNGDLVYEQDDEQIPKKGDIITALTPSQIYNYETMEPMEGLLLEPGVKAKVISVREDDQGNVLAILNFPDN
ncbi:toll/interleukin-1 receptor domain-containing protein [Jejudonia soesokkakensis]|uniref:Toll/interleukin-1 receptor domain-containing protein n=1 Tax=Jejudonia soesokkakensis TaxID=1323432 RepID=A0ABW2MTK3_9FLAO